MGVKTKTSLEKGHNKGGRPKGSVNRLTTAFRETLELHGFNLVQKLIELYQSEKFDEKEKARILFRMMEYSYPKLKEREVTEDGDPVDPPTQINITMTDLIKAARGSEE